jgi:hypothetical protein
MLVEFWMSFVRKHIVADVPDERRPASIAMRCGVLTTNMKLAPTAQLKQPSGGPHDGMQVEPTAASSGRSR